MYFVKVPVLSYESEGLVEFIFLDTAKSHNSKKKVGVILNIPLNLLNVE